MSERDPRSDIAGAGRDPAQIVEAARAQARAAIERSRRRMKLLAAATIVLWALVAAGVILAACFFVTYIVPMYTYMLAAKEPDREVVARVARFGANYSLWASAVWAGLLVLASGSTVALVLASRNATLAQIRASLAEVAEEIRQGFRREPPGDRGADHG